MALRSGLWLQFSGKWGRELIQFADELTSAEGGRPGVILRPTGTANSIARHFQAARAVGEAIMEPCGHLRDTVEFTKQRQKEFPWLCKNPKPGNRAEWETWMREGLDHQQSDDLRGEGEGPSFLVTPSPFITAAAGSELFYDIVDAAEAMRDAYGDSTWLGLTVDRDYMRETPHRTRLANTIAGHSGPGVVFRALHRELPPVTQARYINGLKAMTLAAVGAELDLLLSQSGWLGWLAQGWGAWGFGAGLSGGTWMDKETTGGTNPEEPPNYYFESQLLRRIRWTAHEALAKEDDYEPCRCAYCQEMDGTWDEMLAAKHQLWWANEESVKLRVLDDVASRRSSIYDRLTEAIGFRDGLDEDLQGEVDARFLDTWRNSVEGDKS